MYIPLGPNIDKGICTIRCINTQGQILVPSEGIIKRAIYQKKKISEKSTKNAQKISERQLKTIPE